jgi:Mn2+/Fe2+ NRAMP family transporter
MAGSQDDDLGAGVARQEAAPEGRIRRYLRLLGPGLVTGAADDDPSGVATYAQAGASFGNAMLWTAPVTLPMMIAVQEISDRSALATGESLGTLIRRKFSRRPRIVIGILVVALLVANTLNIAADLMAIGQGMELLGAGPDHLWAAIAGAVIAVTLVTGSFPVIAKVFKWLCLALLAYVGVIFVAGVDWADLLGWPDWPAVPVELGLPRPPRRGLGHDHLPLPVLLAVGPSGRGDARRGPRRRRSGGPP